MKAGIRIPLLLMLAFSLNACLDYPEFHIQKQNSGLKVSCRAIQALDEQTVWIAGNHGSYSYTTDGGKTWNKSLVIGAEELDFRDLHIFSKHEILLMSAGQWELSALYRTTDSGKTWIKTFQNQDYKAFFNAMAFANDELGYLCSDPIDEKPYILKTTDGGKSWNRIPPDVLPPLVEGEYGFAASGSNIYCKGKQVWLATGGNVARVFHSHDEGRSWSVTDTPLVAGNPTSGVFSIHFLNQEDGILVGGNYEKFNEKMGNAAFSKDGGISWTLSPGYRALPFKSAVRYINEDYILCTGTSGTSYSRDAGNNWISLDPISYNSITWLPEAPMGWMVGDNGNLCKITFE